ncbi:unnamed protein product [Cuscuta epithymum]|uniref:Uncharacterized protein n=1 Tax=Cuscuta epithymum TaxID=186058 RepID=A0AAV0GDU0_9ASTE|nr:unnamed protein product [Cuscuta epithymum]
MSKNRGRISEMNIHDGYPHLSSIEARAGILSQQWAFVAGTKTETSLRDYTGWKCGG